MIKLWLASVIDWLVYASLWKTINWHSWALDVVNVASVILGIVILWFWGSFLVKKLWAEPKENGVLNIKITDILIFICILFGLLIAFSTLPGIIVEGAIEWARG